MNPREIGSPISSSFFEQYSFALTIVGAFILVGLAIALWMWYPIIRHKRDRWADR